MKETRNSKALRSFTKYCKKHPEMRFWQALRNWKGSSFIYISDKLTNDLNMYDTFYIEEE